jgi:phage shock protein A
MAYLTSDLITRLQARIATKEAQLLVIEAAITEASIAAQSYRLTTGDGGSTSTEYRSLHELRNNARILEREIDAIYRKLNGTGIVNMNLRRRIFS